MRRIHELLIFTSVGLVGVFLLIWASPRAFPLAPRDWSLSKSEARLLVLEALRDLGETEGETAGETEGDPYIVVSIRSDAQLERRLQMSTLELGVDKIARSELAKALICWDVMVYPPGAAPREWSHRGFVSLDGELLMLRRRAVESADPDADDGEAGDDEADDVTIQRLGWDYLLEQGFRAEELMTPGDVIRDRQGARTDPRVQFRSTEAVLGGDYKYGLEVYFSGHQVVGFGPWHDDPSDDEITRVLRQQQLVGISSLLVVFLLLPVVAVAFLRRYHDGQLGVRRGVHFFIVTLAAAVVYCWLGQDALSEGSNVGFLTRRQMAWVASGFMVIFFYLAASVLGLMSWSVGEYFCRQHSAQKLASLDALFRGKWSNATVARSALRGVAGGLLMTGLLLTLATTAQSHDIWAMAAAVHGEALGGSVGWLSILAQSIANVVPLYLFAGLLVPCWVRHRLGPKAGLVAGWLAITLFVPLLVALPLEGSWALWAIVAVIPALLFHFGDLLAALLAGIVAQTALSVLPGLFASDPLVELNAYVALFLVAAPLILSVRFLHSGEEFIYTYDDVPAHVRRISERERQRVELETAAEIQSSILPDLPDRIAGVDIACSYLPASEVGGDFYDVLALNDGRLAVAVGDVAGHGVSSGLVMAMAKSALAVQVTFNPEVEAVFTTLNRMVYQSARRRLLATLCYALIDPAHRKFHYASAGHLYPYRVSLSGEVDGFETASYPLGVRGAIDVRVHNAELAPRDTLFMCSDGLVEAYPEASDEPFGFERLEASLHRHAGKSPAQMRDAILDDVRVYCGSRPWEDDLTLLVLRLPA